MVRQGAELLVRSTLRVGLDNALECRWRRRFQSLACRHPISDSPLGEDIGGVVRTIPQLAAQPLHDGAHRTRTARTVMTPHLSQQLFMGQHPPGVYRKLGQHPVFCGGQLDRSPANCDPALGVVNAHIAQDIGEGRRAAIGPVLPAEGGLNSRGKLGRRERFHHVVGSSHLEGPGHDLILAVGG